MRKSICSMVAVMFVAGMSLTPLSAAEEKPEKKKPDFEANFKRMDKNSDMKLTEEEFFGKRKDEKLEAAKKLFAKLDKNSDKTLTLEEFKDRQPAKPKKK